MQSNSNRELVKFPENYDKGVNYTTVNRGDVTEELYTSRKAIESVQNGQPIPDGTVITLEIYRVMLVAMAYQINGNTIHEMVGVTLLLLFIAHNILNRRWYKTIFKGKHNVRRILSIAVNLLFLVSMVVVLISSVPISHDILLMLWEIACWTFGAVQNFNLVSLAPESSGIVLSLNSSFVQLGFAAGAGIGGIAVGGSSIMAITWISAASVVCAAVFLILTRSLSHAKKLIAN
ncbi:hypothetical protein [Bacillus sp. AFS031507]|uniref:hypothetical protein n=1 Tax=Bacillus sp. AFS031507 TaxID=2033496 RepID=UPI0015D4C778|nr:hypothetical protein [Bacillus sp. AFS031507]